MDQQNGIYNSQFIAQIYGIIYCLGVIFGYNVTVVDASGVVSFFSTNTESVTVGRLRCCSDYTYKVVARTGAGEGMPSQVAGFTTESQFDGKNDSYIQELCLIFCTLIDTYRVSIVIGPDSIEVSWRTASSILQQQLRSVSVTVTAEAECSTGVVPAQPRMFNVIPEDGNSVLVTIGMVE